MHRFFRIVRDILNDPRQPPALEEELYPRDAMGRPDLQRFTKPLSHYISYMEDYHKALGATGPADAAWQSFAYRKGVLAQWGIIAKGPSEALPYVLGLLESPLPEGRSAAAGILGEWQKDPTFIPHLVSALERDDDIETLSTLAGTLGRLKARAALPRLAALLRAPNSDEGDLSWSVMEAVSAIAGKDFISTPDPKQATDDWLREQGIT